MKIFSSPFFLLALFSLSLVFVPCYVRAQEDDIEEEDDSEPLASEDVQTAAETEADDETGVEGMFTSSPFAKTNILFIQPETSDLPAGKVAKLLVGFKNNGTSPFVVETLHGSFRYPQDFSYHIQNFSLYTYDKVVESEKEATFEYVFTPSETFSQRQFGFTILLKYRNADGKSFVNAVFNDTINVVEPDEGLDGETFFVYIFLGALIILLLVAGNHFLSVLRKKGRSTKYTAQKVSNGGTSTDGVDYEWIPKEHLQQNKSPKVSPRQRKVRNGNGNAVSSSGNSSNDE